MIADKNPPHAGTSPDYQISILMPCLNEAETIGICIAKAQRFLQTHGIEGEIVIADNGSTDASIQIATAVGARVVPVAARGYGAAIIAGAKQCRAPHIIMGDCDDSYDFSDLAGFINGLNAGADIVVGNRFRGGINSGAMPFLHQYLGNPVLSFLARLFFRVNSKDILCGLRGFSRQSILSLGLTTTGMQFGPEMLVKAKLANMNIQEIPTKLYKDGRSRPPHLKTWSDGWLNLCLLVSLLIFSLKNPSTKAKA